MACGHSLGRLVCLADSWSPIKNITLTFGAKSMRHGSFVILSDFSVPRKSFTPQQLDVMSVSDECGESCACPFASAFWLHGVPSSVTLWTVDLLPRPVPSRPAPSRPVPPHPPLPSWQGRKPYFPPSSGVTTYMASTGSSYTYKPRPEAALKILTKYGWLEAAWFGVGFAF
jgi:hypothetical protein